MNIDFQSDGARSLKADVIGNIPVLQFSRGGRELVVKGLSVKGAVEVDRNSVRADLAELGLTTPVVNMTGSFSYDEKLQDFKLALDGSRIEADSVRQAALALAGESETIGTIFDVVRGGRVPWMTVKLLGVSYLATMTFMTAATLGGLRAGMLLVPAPILPTARPEGQDSILEEIGDRPQTRSAVASTEAG